MKAHVSYESIGVSVSASGGDVCVMERGLERGVSKQRRLCVLIDVRFLLVRSLEKW